MKTLLIIPSFNLEKTILQVLEELKSTLPEVKTLVIDYGSQDRTIELLDNNNFKYLSTPLQASYSQALRIGLLYALNENYDAIIEYDGHDVLKVENVKNLLKKIEGFDFVLTSRFADAKKLKKKRFRDRILTWALKRKTKRNISDPLLNFRFYKMTVFQTLINDLNWSGPDAIALLLGNNYNFGQIDISFKNEKMNPKIGDLLLTKWQKFLQIIRWILSILFVQRNSKNNLKIVDN